MCMCLSVLECLCLSVLALTVPQEALQAAEADRIRRENIMNGNPLLAPKSSSEFAVKRRLETAMFNINQASQMGR